METANGPQHPPHAVEQRGSAAALPPDVLESIFRLLKFSDLNACAAVCSLWRDALVHDEMLLLQASIKRPVFKSSQAGPGTGPTESSSGQWAPAMQHCLPRLLIRAAEVGNISAMVAMAEEMESRSEGTRAFEWYRKAARLGHQGSQYRIGEAYYQGEGDWPRDGEEALAWLLRVIKNPQGQPHVTAAAALLLGYMYLDGEGAVRVDTSEAIKWLKVARDLGSLEAEKTVGWLWNTGQY